MDDPAVGAIDPGVVDLGRLGTAAARAPEEDVTGLQVCNGDSLRGRDFAAHRKRRSPLQRAGKRRAPWIRLQLVDAPDEAGAVEPTWGPNSERRLGPLARAAPDVGEADELNRRLEDAVLPCSQGRELELLGERLDFPRLRAAEGQDAGGGVGGFGARRGLIRQQLERIELRGVVDPEPEQTR